MAINRKGMRKIVVDNETYHYKIRRIQGSCDTDYLEVVIERPDEEIVYCTMSTFKDGYYRAITPKEITDLIKLGRWQEIDGGMNPIEFLNEADKIADKIRK